MKNLLSLTLGALLMSGITGACTNHSETNEAKMPEFVTVRDGEFYIGDSAYRYLGTNMWYGTLLASEHYGDRERLKQELDRLQELGVTNLRILAGAEGEPGTSHIEPIMQPRPGEFNDTLLEGMDYLLADLERRNMKAVVYLTNAWEWSGGYGSYLEWTGHGKAPVPATDGYNTYVNYAKQFVLSDSAKQLALNTVRKIVGRTNSITGKPYAESPAIMSWQVCNEPRAFSKEGKDSLESWIIATARAIKEIDPNHLVSTGNEGKYGCETDLELWKRIHSQPEIDYATIHIWPYNWQWVTAETLNDTTSAYGFTAQYIDEHYEPMHEIGKPLVIEEFGYPRDGMEIALGSAVTARDGYYDFVFGKALGEGKAAGVNFWGWSGLAQPAHSTWQAGDDYTNDPAHEAQGLYSVFAGDSTTIEVIKKHVIR